MRPFTQVDTLQQPEHGGGQGGMQVTYMHSKMKGARAMIVGLVISLQRRSSQGGSATKTTAWWQLRPAMEEDHPVGFRNCSRSPQFFSLQSSVSAIKLSCGYRPAFTTVLIVNVVSRPVFRLKKIGETAIKITPLGRRGSGLARFLRRRYRQVGAVSCAV